MKLLKIAAIVSAAVLGVMPALAQNPVIDGLVADMVTVQGGIFTMGSTLPDAYPDEAPAHQVTVSAFKIGRYEVTQQQWQAVMGENPSDVKADSLPVNNVSWDDCQEFISRLNQLTGCRFRLPTEAEWEFAARGGNQSSDYEYAGSNKLADVAWFADNAQGLAPHAVGKKAPNELGLFDMSGNVGEWVQDWYGDYSSEPQINPQGAAGGAAHVTRGGAIDCTPADCTVTVRGIGPDGRYISIGLRLAQSIR